MQRSMTRGKPYKQIVLFTLPLLAGNLFQQFYNMADAFIVSRTLGVEAFAGVSSTGGIVFLILGFAQGLTAGLAIVLSQRYGAEDYEGVNESYVHNLLICVVTGLVLTAVSLLGIRWLLDILRTPADIWNYAYEYLQVIAVGIMASMMFNFFSNTIRALGDSRTPLVYLVVASVLNIILDLVFIQVLSMGVRGAAWATVIAQGFSAILCAFKIRKSLKILSFKNVKGKIQKNSVISNLRVGLPMAFQSSIIALGVIIMQFAINGMGTAAVAAYAVAAKIDGVSVEPLRSFGMAMTTFTAQNYGAKKHRRILTGVKQCLIISSGLAVLLGTLMFTCGGVFTKLFIGNADPQVLALSRTLLNIHGALYIILVFLFVLRFTLQGLGKATIPTVAGIMELAMRALAAAVLVPAFGFLGASIATPLSWLGALIPVAISFVLTVRTLINSDTGVERYEKPKSYLNQKGA